jgi:threonine synthase
LPEPVICLATAHPAKFPETIKRAIGITPELPENIIALLQKPERMVLLPAQIEAVRAFIAERAAI